MKNHGGETTRKALTPGIVSRARHGGGTYATKDGREVARREILWDLEPRGLGLRLHPSGRKTWVFRYRYRGREYLRDLGDFPTTPLDSNERDRLGARQRARVAAGRLAGGEDPFPPRAEGRTVAGMERDFRAAVEDRGVKPATRAKYVESFALVAAALGSRLVDELDSESVRRAFRAWRDERGPYAAKAALRVLRDVLAVAADCGLRSDDAPDPTAKIRGEKDRRRGLEFSAEELARLGAALDAEEARQPDLADAVAALRLLALTGARRREITGLTWGEVDLGGRRLRLRDSKTGAREVALGTAALAILASLPRVEGEARVFPASRHEVGWSVGYLWKRVRAAAGLPADARIHDLRHSYVTGGLALNFSEALVGKAVGHRSPATTRRYSHLALDPVREVAERIGAAVDSKMRGEAPAEVVTLHERKGS